MSSHIGYAALYFNNTGHLIRLEHDTAAIKAASVKIFEDLDTCGLDACRTVRKSDQEPSIVEVQNRIAELRRQAHSHGTTIENSKVGDSNSNARVERAVQKIGGLVRTMKAALESRLGMKIDLNHIVVPWMVLRSVPKVSISVTSRSHSKRRGTKRHRENNRESN